MRMFFVHLMLCMATYCFAQQKDMVYGIDSISLSEIAFSNSEVINNGLFKVIYFEKEFKTRLKSVPTRSENIDISDLPTISLPLPTGENMKFYIEEASIMHPKLQEKFPEIRSYIGYGVKDSHISLRFSVSPEEYNFSIYGPGFKQVSIAQNSFNKDLYDVFYKKDLTTKDGQPIFHCSFDPSIHKPDGEITPQETRSNNGDQFLREYRLAVACTGEYASYHGGTSTDAMAAINQTMTKVNAIYERDFSIRMILVPNNDLLIYTDSNSDPFTNGNAGVMIDQNRDNTNLVIGSSNYDIGHLFGTAGSGLAYLNGPCGANKARAVSAIGNPIGDAFDVDYVCHEIGHQFGANHIQYNSCNRNNSTAVEPGSGSTIMGYAGICSPNIQNNSDPYFNGINVEEIENFTTVGNGNTCSTNINLGNNFPSVDAGLNYAIPHSTPFTLTASANDIDGDELSYCWEQKDNIGSDQQPPISSNSNGPLFRSFEPSLDSIRYFPSLNNIINDDASTWEVLPSVGRTLNFTVTVRDNVSSNGLTSNDDVQLTVDGNSGPFVVSSPNAAVQWLTGETKTIAWDVANTNQAPINCGMVDILLSLDGGYTYPITLATNVTNDGTHDIIVPNHSTSFARIRINASNNIFFDISDMDFGINLPPFPSYCTVNYNNNSCSTNDYIDDVTFNTISNTQTGCATDGNNYSDYTQMITTVNLGSNYNLTVKPTPNYAEYIAAYIDWNLDGDFLDVDEFIDLGHTPAGTDVTSTINIPNTTSTGYKLLRVVSRYGTTPLIATDGCGIGLNYGETEDYLINVVIPCNFNESVTTNYTANDVEVISAENNVIANNLISAGANITYIAGNSIQLNNGFSLQAGATFEAFIGPCQ